MSSPRPGSTALDAETLLSHGAWLAGLARALVARDDEVDDVVQSTYARALEQPPRHAGNVKGWLGTVARNVVRMRARSDSARVAREAALPPPPPVETPHEAVERAELRRLVVEAVLALPEPYKSTVILRFFEERDVAAIARLTSAGEESVRTRLRRGIERVRAALERKVDPGTRGAAREGVAARALLWIRLREIAASGGGGGASASAVASRGLARAARRRATKTSARAIGLGAAAAVVVAGFGGWVWWSRAGEQRRDEVDREVAAVAEVPPEREAEPVASREAVPPVAVQPGSEGVDDGTHSPPSGAAATHDGTIRGVVTGIDGGPVADARVWAIISRSHDPPPEFPRFAPAAREQASSDPSNPAFTWIERRTDADGRYEFSGLSIVAAWAIGAYHPAIGAGLSDQIELDRAHREQSADVRLVRGARVRGTVADEAGTPIGGATIMLHTSYGRRGWNNRAMSDRTGAQIGAFEFEYQCSEAFAFSCAVPTFEPTQRYRIDLAPGATGVVLPIRLKRRPGVLVRGPLVAPSGEPFDLAALLDGRFSVIPPQARWKRASVWAIAADATPPPLLLSGMTAPGLFEGRIDCAQSAYEVVVPDGFAGTIELRIVEAHLASAALEDLREPPDLVCDEAGLPEFAALTTCTARFVDATTQAPIDLSTEHARPFQLQGGAALEVVPSGCDLERGLLQFRCPVGPATFVPDLAGYAPSRLSWEATREPSATPMTFEIAPAVARLHGFAFGSDGRPLRRADVALFRATPQGWIDAMREVITTNGDGEFEVDAVAAGEHAVIIAGDENEAPGVVRFFASAPAVEVEVRSTPGRPVDFRFHWKGGEPGKSPPTSLTIRDRHQLPVIRLANHIAGADVVPLEALTLRLEDGPYSAFLTSWRFGDVAFEFDVPRDSIDVVFEPAEVR